LVDSGLPSEVVEAHDAAVRAAEDGYVDPRTGFLVFTSAYLLVRGECCGSGCRHCPYPQR